MKLRGKTLRTCLYCQLTDLRPRREEYSAKNMQKNGRQNLEIDQYFQNFSILSEVKRNSIKTSFKTELKMLFTCAQLKRNNNAITYSGKNATARNSMSVKHIAKCLIDNSVTFYVIFM